MLMAQIRVITEKITEEMILMTRLSRLTTDARFLDRQFTNVMELNV
jgi:hypothetical protein